VIFAVNRTRLTLEAIMDKLLGHNRLLAELLLVDGFNQGSSSMKKEQFKKYVLH